MIVVLCDGFQEALDAFDCFIQFLEEEEPWSIRKINEFALRVETEYDLTYIFTDYHYAGAFEEKTLDILDATVFFEGIDYWEGVY